MDQLAAPFDLNAKSPNKIDGGNDPLDSRTTITYNFITENNNFSNSAFPSFKTDAVTQTEPEMGIEGYCISCKEEFPWWRDAKNLPKPELKEPTTEDRSDDSQPKQAPVCY